MDFILNGFYEAFLLLYHLDSETLDAIYNTILTSSISIIISTLIGLPAGFALGYFNFWGKKSIKLLCDTLLAFPTVVVGLVVVLGVACANTFGKRSS